MRYILDISKATKPAWWEAGDPVLLPCKDGAHYTTYDLIEKELPAEFIKKIRAYLYGLKLPDGRPYHYASVKRLPIGIDAEEVVKHGGVLREAQK